MVMKLSGEGGRGYPNDDRCNGMVLLFKSGTANLPQRSQRSQRTATTEHRMNVAEMNVRSGQIIDAGMRVHSALGPGLLESAYEACLAYELRKRGLRVETQVALPVIYDGQRIDVGYRLDLRVESTIIVEVKAVAKLTPIFSAQLLSYLRLGKYQVGLLMNFHAPRLKDGIKRIVNEL